MGRRKASHASFSSVRPVGGRCVARPATRLACCAIEMMTFGALVDSAFGMEVFRPSPRRQFDDRRRASQPEMARSSVRSMTRCLNRVGSAMGVCQERHVQQLLHRRAWTTSSPSICICRGVRRPEMLMARYSGCTPRSERTTRSQARCQARRSDG